MSARRERTKLKDKKTSIKSTIRGCWVHIHPSFHPSNTITFFIKNRIFHSAHPFSLDSLIYKNSQKVKPLVMTSALSLSVPLPSSSPLSVSVSVCLSVCLCLCLCLSLSLSLSLSPSLPQHSLIQKHAWSHPPWLETLIAVDIRHCLTVKSKSVWTHTDYVSSHCRTTEPESASGPLLADVILSVWTWHLCFCPWPPWWAVFKLGARL